MPHIVIASEDDLFRALERLVAEEKAGRDRDWEVTFDGWPRYEITIRGEDFDGGIPTRVMPALLDLQKKVNEGYSRLVYGELRSLTKEEKRKTELIVRVKPGSTTFFSDLYDVLNSIAQQALNKMDGTQTLISILAIAAVTGGTIAFKFWLDNRCKEKDIETKLKLSAEDTRRIELITEVVGQSTQIVRDQVEAQAKAFDGLVKRLHPEDELVSKGERIIDGETGRKLVRSPRQDTIESRLDGEFIIMAVYSGGVRGGYRLEVRKIDDNSELQVTVPEGTLAEQQIRTLQEGEWGKLPLMMQLNTRKRGELIVDATLIEAGLL